MPDARQARQVSTPPGCHHLPRVWRFRAHYEEPSYDYYSILWNGHECPAYSVRLIEGQADHNSHYFLAALTAWKLLAPVLTSVRQAQRHGMELERAHALGYDVGRIAP